MKGLAPDNRLRTDCIYRYAPMQPLSRAWDRLLPQTAHKGGSRMKWITRAHVKADRVACPWLIKKFVDKDAEKLGGIPYNVKGVELGHHGKECSFEAIMQSNQHIHWGIPRTPEARR